MDAVDVLPKQVGCVDEFQHDDTTTEPSNETLEDSKLQDWETEERYKKLVALLTRSQFYTEFLHKKIVSQKNPTSKQGKKNKISKKPLNDSTNMQGNKSVGQQGETSGSLVTRRRARAASNATQVMNIAVEMIETKKQKLDAGEDNIEEITETGVSASKTLNNGLVVPVDQPDFLTGASLRDYQMEGLNWLKVLYENGVNGILADEMGLGKTIQVIALICHLVQQNMLGPFLIIGPLSTLPNWMIEFERFAPELPVVMYYGTEVKRQEVREKMKKKRKVRNFMMLPVVLTSYEYPLRDAKILRNINWRYIIVDEGHRLKNHEAQLSKALRTYHSTNRLLLTGTPLHNNLSELWSLLNFLVPEIFDNLEVFESWFNVLDLESEQGNKKLIEEERKGHIVTTMHKILSPFLLRRVKSDVNLNLPPKKEIIVYAPMTPFQVDLYRAVLDFNYNQLTRKVEIIPDVDGVPLKRSCREKKVVYYVKNDEVFEEHSDDIIDSHVQNVVKNRENPSHAIAVKMQNPMMILRKIVNHPYLVQYPLIPGTAYAQIDEDLVKCSGKLLVLDAVLNKLRARGHKVLLFSTFTSLLDIIEDFLSLRDYKHYRLDGNTSLEDRKEYIDNFNRDPNMFLFLISTRAGGLGINLASADTVILYDSDWNPQIDLQAQDRCHRIGQTRPVVVYRFVTAGTIDERVVVRGNAKRKLEKLIIRKGQYSSLKKEEDAVDIEELMQLLTSRDHQRVIHANGYVFSDEELDELLDRSDMAKGQTQDSSTGAEAIEARSFKEYYGYVNTISGHRLPRDISNENLVASISPGATQKETVRMESEDDEMLDLGSDSKIAL